MSSAAPTPPSSPTRSHIPALDGLRALAVVAVVVLHTTMLPIPLLGGLNPWYRFAEMGWVGVDLFFVLSGFLITGILLDTRGGRGYFRSFYLRRTVRIFPLYYAVLVLVLLLLPRLAPGLIHHAGRLEGGASWSWTYLSNLRIAATGDWASVPQLTEHFWSLAVEEQFYLLWPTIVLLSGRRIRDVCLATIVGALLLRVYLLHVGGSPIAAFVLTPTRADALAAGALVACLARQEGGLERYRRWAKAGVVIFGLAVVAAWALAGLSGAWRSMGATTQYTWPMQTIGYSALALGFACVLLLVVTIRSSSHVARWLSAAPLRHIGERSYAIYVLHPLVLKAFTRVAPMSALSGAWGQLFVTVGVGAGALVVAEISWHAWEKHWLALKRYAPYPKPAMAIAPIATEAPVESAEIVATG